MAIPDFQTLMLPALRRFADGKEKRSVDVRALLASEFVVTPKELAQGFARGVHTVYGNRFAWALSYLKRAGILDSPRRGIYIITQRGSEVLKKSPRQIDIPYLRQFREFVHLRGEEEGSSLESFGAGPQQAAREEALASVDSRVLTPDEQIHAGAARIRESLAAQILERIRKVTPAAFELLVVDVLVAMGYGGSHEQAAQVVGKSGDSGIDGIIKEDRLGLESIYVQAKRWEATVGRPVIQQFAGALHGNRARKGVMITTSSFSREAIDYADTSQITIILIDGMLLADLMIEFGVGVNDVETIKIQRVDEDYFSTDE